VVTDPSLPQVTAQIKRPHAHELVATNWQGYASVDSYHYVTVDGDYSFRSASMGTVLVFAVVPVYKTPTCNHGTFARPRIPHTTMHAVILSVGLLSALSALAAPAPEIVERASITAYSSAQVAAFKPFTWYASAGHCPASQTAGWTCGTSCNANPNFKPIASGGDGDSVQFWYVGYDPTHATIIVAHQGTDTSKLLPILTDVEVPRRSLNSALFPGVSSSVGVHDGFADVQEKSASQVLAAVKSGLSAHGINSITTVGHSLGAALALIDAVYLKVQIPSATVSHYGYGLPRVGNQAFADYVDAHLNSFTRITNLKDPVPIVPGRFLGFHHPSNEAHIDDGLVWKNCPGQDNTDAQCSIGDTPNIFESDTSNHSGPYDGIIMGTGC